MKRVPFVGGSRGVGLGEGHTYYKPTLIVVGPLRHMSHKCTNGLAHVVPDFSLCSVFCLEEAGETQEIKIGENCCKGSGRASGSGRQN